MPNDPQVFVISEGGCLSGLGSLSQWRVATKQQAFPVMSRDTGKQETVLCSMRRQLGHNQGEKNKPPANGI